MVGSRGGEGGLTWKEQLPGSESYSSFTPIGLRKSLDAPSPACACVFSQTAENKAAARFICVQLLFPGLNDVGAAP
jgi:hypothetical protein